MISILRGNGDGTFAPATYHGRGAGVRAVTLADLDTDGIPEIVATRSTYYPANVSVLRGADGWASAGQHDYPAGPDAQLIEVVDVDGDGRLDVVTGGGQPYASVLYGRSDGSLGAWSPIDFGPSAISTAAIADLNRDGRPDLVVSDRSGQALGVRLGNGNGTFAPAVFSTPGVIDPQIADLDGDGMLDVVGIHGVSGNGVLTLLGNGDGSFSEGATFPAGIGANGTAIGDINGDGRADLAVTFTSGVTDPRAEISILLGDGAGGFTAGVPVPGFTWTLPVLADLNRDGHLDLIAAMNAATVMIGNGDWTFYRTTGLGVGARCAVIKAVVTP